MNNSYTITVNLDDAEEVKLLNVHPYQVDAKCRRIINKGFSVGGVDGSGGVFDRRYIPAHRVVNVFVS